MAATTHPHGISIPDVLYRRIQLAAGASKMSVSAFMCAASDAAVEHLSENDPAFRLYVLEVEARERRASLPVLI